jgi:radical SAM superfamily enzyme YgiQ (UPF0313 family)
MRIVFLHDGYEHLGIGYLSAVAQNHGHTVDLVSARCGDYIRGRRELDAKRLERIVSRMLASKPDVAAFSLNTFMAGNYSRIASALRRRGVRTVAGGPHATAEPALTLESGSYDGLVALEAESVFPEALEYILQRNGPCPPWLHTPEHPAECAPPLPRLDSLPFPAKHLVYGRAPIEARDYKIITSRGCPFRCIFCAPTHVAGEPAYRRRSIDSVLAELQWARRQFHPSTVYFLDDIFTMQRAWLQDFLREYKERIGIPFHVISHPAYMTNEIAAMLKSASCFRVRLGVQSLTPRVKTLLGRPESNGDVIRALSAARKYDLPVEVDHMVNVPAETLAEAREGIAVYNVHRPDAIKVYWLVPLPGTAWFAQALADGHMSQSTADDIRRGRGFGKHSYLFFGKAEFYDGRWLGIHFLLAYLPLLPRFLVAFLLRVRADRFLRIPSFFFLVGLSRIVSMVRGGDTVGGDHLRRLLRNTV